MKKQFAYEKMMESFPKQKFVGSAPKRIMKAINECEEFYKAEKEQYPYATFKKIDSHEIDTNFIAGIQEGSEIDALAQILQYYKDRGIELDSQQLPKVFVGQIKHSTTQDHAASLSTWLEDPRIEKEKAGMFITDNKNPWLGGSRVGSRINYSEPALNERGRKIPGEFVHPEEVAEYTAQIAKGFKGKDLQEFEAHIKSELFGGEKLYTWRETSLLQAMLRNIQEKRNEYQIAKGIEPVSKLGSLSIKNTDIKQNDMLQK